MWCEQKIARKIHSRSKIQIALVVEAYEFGTFAYIDAPQTEHFA